MTCLGLFEILCAPLCAFIWLVTPKQWVTFHMKSGNKVRVRAEINHMSKLNSSERELSWHDIPCSYTTLRTIDLDQVEAVTVWKL